MSTSRSIPLYLENSKSGPAKLPGKRTVFSSVALSEGGEGAINNNGARQGSPFDHGIMIARPGFAPGGPGRIHNGKQNVNRCHPPGGNPGGGDARQSG